MAGFIAWFNSLDATFTFLLLLPIAVALAGFLAEFIRARNGTDGADR